MTEHLSICPKGLAVKISKVLKKIGWIEKNGENKFHKYCFASASEVFSEVNSACQEFGITSIASVIPDSIRHVEMSGEKTSLRTEFVMMISLIDNETGDTWTSTFPGLGIDTGDKGVNKAITSARKYGLLGMLGIPTGKDPDEESPNIQRAQKAKDPEPPAIHQLKAMWNTKRKTNDDANKFKDWIRENTRIVPQPNGWEPHPWERQIILDVIQATVFLTKRL